MKSLKLLKIDIYIIKKFLGTFFFCLCLILAIAVIFDFSEKIDDFMENEAPVKAIIFDYYLNFIPYFATLFAPLFVFISVIIFTARMASNTEIIAILNSGMSFKRMMWPYFLSSFVIAMLIFYLMNFVIPNSNRIRTEFESKYYRPRAMRTYDAEFVHRQISPDTYVYIESFNAKSNRGRNFTLEKLDEDGRLKSKISSSYVLFDTATGKWGIQNYVKRDVTAFREEISKGTRMDTTLSITPEEFSMRADYLTTMTFPELEKYIDVLTLQGSEELKLLLVERQSRLANPFSVFILTLIGVSLSSRKIRGGIGMNIGLGLVLSFSYILFQQFASQFCIKGNLDPAIAMWIPNILYAVIALVLYKFAPK